MTQYNYCNDNLPEDVKWTIIKSYRDYFLQSSDWTQLSDVPLSLEEKTSWAEYRQNLRDITENFENADDVVFPEKPYGQ